MYTYHSYAERKLVHFYVSGLPSSFPHNDRIDTEWPHSFKCHCANERFRPRLEKCTVITDRSTTAIHHPPGTAVEQSLSLYGILWVVHDPVCIP
jgi:hypothetical protein